MAPAVAVAASFGLSFELAATRPIFALRLRFFQQGDRAHREFILPINIGLACFFARRPGIAFCFAKIVKPEPAKKRTEFRNCRREE